MTEAKIPQLPAEMLTFEILKPASSLAPRLGRLSIPGRATLQTPHYIGHTSRGVVPHLTQDMLRKHTDINAIYCALEDFIEKAPKQTPPVYSTPSSPEESPLRCFTSLHKEALLVLGPRRVPPIHCPSSNTNSTIAIHTSVGFSALSSQNYAAAAQRLRPDIVIGLGDIMHGHAKPSLKRMDKMGDRTAVWTKDLIAGQGGLDKTVKTKIFNIFAPILPIDREMQSWYLDKLVDDMQEHISGLALYDVSSLEVVPVEFSDLPRLSLSNVGTPHKLLHAVSLGMDLFDIPFIGAATDAGIVLDFQFPVAAAPPAAEAGQNNKRPLGIDMWLEQHATDVVPLEQGCTCYACTKHHRAYLHHLLNAKEMLGWVLIQVHNHAVMDRFFAGVRASIERGTFEEDRAAFGKVYEAELPEKTGQGPRVRGYQFKSEGPGEPKKNASAYRMLDEQKEVLDESITPGENTDAHDLEEKGFAEVQHRSD